MFRLRLAACAAANRRKVQGSLQQKKSRRRKKSGKDSRTITGCIGKAVRLGERCMTNAQPILRVGCSSRCRHAVLLKDSDLSTPRNKSDDWVNEELYKRYKDAESRPPTPHNFSRRSISHTRPSSVGLEKARKCVTPEPDAKPCQFHSRRVLILDLRRVKSVDAITRQNSITTGESVDNSTYGDYDYDNRSSSLNRDSASIFLHSTPRNFSISRSTSPKNKPKSKLKKPKDRSGSPIAYERSTSPKILEGLTLPPLHQSVLALLGQKSGLKSTPRSQLKAEANAGSAFDASSTSKAKKLRRHGRKKKAKEDGKESEEKELEKDGISDLPDGGDELQETQLSTLNRADQTEEEEDESDEHRGKKSVSCEREPRRSLREVLDEHLSKERWSQKEMENLDENIETLTSELQKYSTDFKTKSISMPEDTWLAYPRTWTRTSATFGVPSSSKLLRELNPIEYLQKYVTITEPRQHLYNLIYQRYRILENPTGKSITVKSLQRALTEVLGRQFTDEELSELQTSFLNVGNDYELHPKAFAGICAFCERIYGKYALEDCTECIICSRSNVHDKERCHVKKKSELEEMDLAYLSNKIKFGEASDSITRLISALTKDDRRHVKWDITA
ncbi:unnamed protein product [Orchesella dallaii]|uniref:Uncharacterized protein n=1 Tax=Orchesella dallaii TaxID=48710 RepID=A0ABP1R027_9HEXA